MKSFLTVLKFELGNYFKNKSFMITTLLLALFGALAIAVPPMIPGLLDGGEKKEASKEAGSKEEDSGEAYGIVNAAWSEEDLAVLLKQVPGTWESYLTQEELVKAVESEEVAGGFVLTGDLEATYVMMNNSMVDRMEPAVSQAMLDVRKGQILEEKGFTPEEIQALDTLEVQMDSEILGKDSVSNYWYTYILVFALYFLILFYGQMIAVSVTTEKSNRAIEILVTSVSSNSLILGKVIAGALAGVIQMGLILAAVFGTYAVFRTEWGGLLDMVLHVPAPVLAAYAVFGLLGYLLYALAFGALGALVSKTEDISKSSSMLTMLYVVAFFIAIFGMTNSDSLLMRVTSFIPFVMHNSMFIRIAMGSVAAWEIVLSLGILIVACVVTGLLAAKLFRMGTLMYGNPIKLSSALKKLRQQN